MRELLFQGYRIIYRTKLNRIQINTVIHGSRTLATTEVEPWEVG